MNGGLAGLFWSLLWTYVGQAFVVVSLAELASMAPTAGGQHHWVSEFAQRRWRRSLSYSAGWLDGIARQSITATNCYIIADAIQGLISVNNPHYAPSRWAATFLTISTAVVLSVFNTFAARHLTVSEGILTTCHVFAFMPVGIIFVTLWVMVEPKTPAAEAFLHVRNNGDGWPHPFVSACTGQIPCIYATSGFYAVIHLADEVENAALTIPRGMVWAFCLSFPLAVIMLVTYCMNIGSIEKALGGRYPPYVAVFQNALGTPSAVTAFTVIILALLVTITISVLAATSRQIVAFARDRGLPLSQDLGKLSGSCEVPGNAIFATACVTSVLSLIQLGGDKVWTTTLALACASLMATSTLSIGSVTLRRIRKQRLPQCPWSLGHAGLPINFCALFYTGWAFFWSLFPTLPHPTAVTFNWASMILVVAMGWAATLFFQGKTRYEAPFPQVEERMGEL